MNEIYTDFTKGNSDDLHAAINALNHFTKNWCMNCKETRESGTLVFRCSACPFNMDDGVCLVKKFCKENDPSYMREIDFGCMGSL